MKLEKTLKMNVLFSFYKELLTDKQSDYLSEYYEEDYSLAEIAVNHGVSRQAVYDSIQRTEASLKDYEEKLQLIKEFEKRKKIIENIQEYLSEHYPEDQFLEESLNEIILDRKREEN